MTCAKPSCFFCLMKEPDSPTRKAGISEYFKEMPLVDDQGHVLVLSGLWSMAMTRPDDPDLPSLGVFHCMTTLIRRALTDQAWLLRDQNIYIPYYASHVIGSYTMNKPEFAQKAVKAGVIPPLMELLRGNLSWVEQRVAVRALGHLASYESTFEAVAAYEEEIIDLSMNLASTCLEVVYTNFVGKEKRLKYHRDLLTRGIGGSEMENRKAEEWASQLQCWSIYLLNTFAIKERSINLMCKKEFLEDLSDMWGGLVNASSPSGVGLIRILCYTQIGRRRIAEVERVVKKLCNLSRSSDDWQYMGIDCLLLLLNDPHTRYKVIEVAAWCLADLVELKTLGGRSNLGEIITKTLLLDFTQRNTKIKNKKLKEVLEEVLNLKVVRKKRERTLSSERIEERRVLSSLIKQQGNHSFWVGEIEEALIKYTEAIELCPLKLRKERVVLYSNRAQCELLLGNFEKAISDTTRALCLCSPVNSHGKSLWRRSQAYDMEGMARESLMDCVMFINGCHVEGAKHVRIPYYAARMITKQMETTWLFADARSKSTSNHADKAQQSEGDDRTSNNVEDSSYGVLRMIVENKGLTSGLSTIIEEPLIGKSRSSWKKLERG
ncbi:hypothetical protein NMG60_11031220 [Bertholletia excelsa]